MLTERAFGGWTALFLATTILTSVTGFPLPPFGFDPPRAVGALSLVLLAGLKESPRLKHASRCSSMVSIIFQFHDTHFPIYEEEFRGIHNAMNHNTSDLDYHQTEEETLIGEVSDDALEAASGTPTRGVPTLFHNTYCFGCPA